MKKKTFLYIVSVLVIGILTLTITSCKRSKVEDPSVIPNAGIRIALSGTANPSTLYVPETQPAVFSSISVRALDNKGAAVANRDIIFQCDAGYFENYKISSVRRTNSSGIAQITYFIPPGVNLKSEGITYITATLVDDGRLDNYLARIFDKIPIHIIPYASQGLRIHGNVLTPAGDGVAGVVINYNGGNGFSDGVAVTRVSGSYEFYVEYGWWGEITPDSNGYRFIPTFYEFDEDYPITADIDQLDFVAIFESGNQLVTDVSQWNVPIQGGTQVVNVYNGTGDATISYIVVPDMPWIHVSPMTGQTPGSFTISVDANTTGADRSGSVDVTATDTEGGSTSVTIIQPGEGASSDARLAVDIATVNVPWQLTSQNINVFNSTTDEPIDYFMTSVPENDWISLSSTSGSTPDNFTITAANNYGAARSGQVILTPSTTGVNNTVTIYVNQEGGPSLALDITSRYVSAAGEVFVVTVTNPTNSDPLGFTATNNELWIGNTPVNSVTPSQITITVNANGTGVQRTGLVTFTPTAGDKVILTITQEG